jgi:hypothetical protein
MKPILKRYAAEAIAHQDPALFNEISLIISEVKSLPKLHESSLQESRLPKLIMDRLGLNVKFVLVNGGYGEAASSSPIIDPNHVLIKEYQRSKWDSKAPKKIAQRVSEFKKRLGTVDRKNSKVSGLFSDIEFEIYMSGSFFFGGFTPNETSAVILHELGHNFTFLEMLSVGLSTNQALTLACREFFELASEEDRILLLTELEHSVGFTIEEKEETAKITDPTTLTTVLVKDYVEGTRSEFGTPLFDMRTAEYLADQFSTRHGAASALVSALAKIYEGHRSSRSTPFFLFVELMKVMLYVPGGLLATLASGDPIDTFVALFLTNPYSDAYDPPELRMEKIKRDLNLALKQKDLRPELEKRILVDLKVIEQLIKDYHDRESLWQKIFLLISPGTRKQRRTYKMQIELEKLAANNLYARAAEFRQLQS